ncbi:flagellar hook-associated protein FlgK [Sandaracinobacteroides hominis]|uniref:flagellar hook-associated protein FlgK n=1 Tax=Sandaracinobacteroides hominis TaxID=2780086 RepID=UPI0018F768E7|nr:flagellar basal body rod C-terminal domain-containing protein [Sandaracinobacteroides hominis]
MSDLLAIAQSGVRAYSRALETVADNVANASTPGHVRRTSTLAPAVLGGLPGPLELDPRPGNGVKLVGVERAIDLLRVDTLRRADADVSALDATKRWLTAVEATLSGPNALDAPLSDLFSSLSDLASDPANLAVRSAFLANADAVADRFNDSAAELEKLDSNLQLEAQVEAETLTDLAQGLAEINGQLRRAPAGSGASVTLQDERDRVLAKIATIVGVDVTIDVQGQAHVRIPDAGGPLLVSGTSSASARILPSAGGFELRIGPKGADEPATLVSGILAGLSVSRTYLGQARDHLDALAVRVSEDFNAVHQQGVDLSGADGGDLFALGVPRVTAATANGSAARVSASVADGASAMAMTLSFDGTQWTLARDDLLGSVSGALPLSLDGTSISAIGDARAGDLFRIGAERPASALHLRPLSAVQVAASARYTAEPAQSNVGEGKVELRIGSALAVPATPPFNVASLADGSLQLSDSLGTVLANGPAGGWMIGDGFEVRVTGALVDGDSFSIDRTAPGSAGNGNATALLALKDTAGPAGTLADQHDLMISSIAVQLAATRNRATVATEARNRAAEALTDMSGVDLNSEAAEMLRLQQAFQANARIIQMARETFDAILAAAN